LDDGVAEYHFYYGSTLLKQNRMKPAVKAFERAIKLAPRNADYHAELGDVFLQMGFPTRAKGFFEKALKINPGHKRAAERLAAIAGK
jgi:tetratricopeptide (TPR) repeat protein